MDDIDTSPTLARIAGLALIVAAMAAGYVLATYSNPPSISAAGRWFFYLFFGGITVVALLLGVRLIRSDDRDPTLPSWALYLGIALLVLGAIVQIVLVVLLHSLAAIESALVFGFGGALAAWRLLRRRSQHLRDGA
jgi:drug/metabolite transporter (DMT)-like permease